MAERAADLTDVSQRVLVHLLGAPPATAVPHGAILVADELLPSQLLALDRAHVGAVVTARGGTTAHAAILAAGLGLPMLVAAGETLLAVADGEWLITRGADGMTVAREHAKGDVAVRGAASDLLLVVMGRAEVDVVEVLGDEIGRAHV